MSINWHYFKTMNRRPTVTIPKAAAGSITDLYQFTGFKMDQRQVTQTGRSWRPEELRLKDHDDLHKLWYVLLKEKNKLKSDFLISKQLGQMFYGHSNIIKVKTSMARLLTVVNERKKLRNEYRKHLEDDYIQNKKDEEKALKIKEVEDLRAQGLSMKMTEDEFKVMMKKKQAGRIQSAKEKLDQLVQEHSDATEVSSPLHQEDLSLITEAQNKLTQGDIFKMYVKNWAGMDLKQRRKVMGHVQAQRSRHAKEIFLKELATVGKKMKKQPEAMDTTSRVKNMKDPLKLKLEGISQ